MSVCAFACVCGGVEGGVKSEKAVPLQVGKVPVATNMRNRREDSCYRSFKKSSRGPITGLCFKGRTPFSISSLTKSSRIVWASELDIYLSSNSSCRNNSLCDLASFLPSLCLSFLNCKWGIIVSTSQSCWGQGWNTKVV